MFKNKLLTLILLTCYCQISVGQDVKQKANLKKDYNIPFQLTEFNNLSIQAILNDVDTVHLMFHTAANAVTLTEESTKKLKSLNFDNTTDSVKSWGGQSNSSRMSTKNSLQIGGLKWEDVPIWENINSGQHTDGKFGIDLFKNQVIEIDFDKKRIVIYQKLPKKVKKYEKHKLIFEDDLMFLEADCVIENNVFNNKFLIHSGYAGAVLVDDKFASDKKLGEKLKIVGEKALKDSYGNVLKTKKAILPTFKIGNEKLNDVPVGFFEGAIGRQKMSIIGGDILKRFNFIIDPERQYIYMKANRLKNGNYSNV